MWVLEVVEGGFVKKVHIVIVLVLYSPSYTSTTKSKWNIEEVFDTILLSIRWCLQLLRTLRNMSHFSQF